jgi:hypothetical protein
MGCDIHPAWEVQTASGKWLCKGGVQCLGRDYMFFALIADVRNNDRENGYIEPMFAERGVPDDSPEGIRKEFEDCCDYHSPSHFYLDEFKNAFENDMKDLSITYSQKYDLLSYYKKTKGTLDGYYRGLPWQEENTYKETKIEDFNKVLKDDSIKCMLELNTMPPEYKKLFVKTEQKTPYQDEFRQTYKELMKEAQDICKNKPLHKIRVVYWFDN